MNHWISKKHIKRIVIFLVIVAFFSFSDYSSFVYPIKVTSVIFLIGLSGHIENNKYLKWILGFIMFSLLSCIWSIDSFRVIAYIIWTGQAMFIAYSIGLTIEDEEDINFIFKCITIGGFILGIRGLKDIPLNQLGTYRIGKNIGYNENELALKSALGSIVSFYYLIKTKTIKMKILLLFTFVIPVMAVVFSGSRKGIVMVVVTILIFNLFNSKNPLKLLRNIVLGIFGVYIFFIAINNIEILYNSFGRRFLLLFNIFDEGAYVGNSISNRLYDVEMGIIAFKDSPLFGYGLGNYQFATGLNGYAHNNYIQLLVDLGIIGIFLYYYFYLYIGFNLFKTIALNRIQTSLCLSILIVVIIIEYGLVSFNSDYVQLVIMLCFYTTKLNKEKKEINGEENE